MKPTTKQIYDILKTPELMKQYVMLKEANGSHTREETTVFQPSSMPTANQQYYN
jgi:hypothetical protein